MSGNTCGCTDRRAHNLGPEAVFVCHGDIFKDGLCRYCFGGHLSSL